MEQNIHLPGLNHNGIRSGSFSGSSRLFSPEAPAFFAVAKRKAACYNINSD